MEHGNERRGRRGNAEDAGRADRQAERQADRQRATAAPRRPRARNAPVRRRRRPRGSLTREAVVEAALALVDADGVDALSMPRLARRLDAGVMTLYSYVRGKQELLDEVAMRAIAEVRLGESDARTWDATLLSWGRGLRQTLLAHPGVAGVLASRAVIGPGIFRGVEGLLHRLRAAEFPAEAALRAIYSVLIFTLGFVMWEVPRVHAQSASAYATQWREAYARMPVGTLPEVAGLLPTLGTLASDEQFEFGLRALVAGLRAAAEPGAAPWVRHAEDPG